MSELDDKSNNEILLGIKQLQQEHESIKDGMIKDYDAIEGLKAKMKKDLGRLETVESKFAEANKIIVGRLKGEI